MPDFVGGLVTVPRLSVGSTGYSSLLADYANCTNIVTTTGAVWPSANRAIFVAFYTDVPLLAQKMGIQVTTQSGNCDVGIYDYAGNKLVSKGSTAVAAAGLQTFDITDTQLNPGAYWLAMCVDNTTAAFTRLAPAVGPAQVSGVQQAALGSVTLTSTVTFANPASAYVPVVTIQCGSVL